MNTPKVNSSHDHRSRARSSMYNEMSLPACGEAERGRSSAPTLVPRHGKSLIMYAVCIEGEEQPGSDCDWTPIKPRRRKIIIFISVVCCERAIYCKLLFRLC